MSIDCWAGRDVCRRFLIDSEVDIDCQFDSRRDHLTLTHPAAATCSSLPNPLPSRSETYLLNLVVNEEPRIPRRHRALNPLCALLIVDIVLELWQRDRDGVGGSVRDRVADLLARRGCDREPGHWGAEEG